ncbi:MULTISPECIES: RdgB/HAM1 family non-canonical purine NTP pyrophosphatase [unclassified Brevibacterium]|uniref:RdgB/HAM1 family non-canonical purine NTP pyrophosphatase n=1 Tax=unclassified Brevibacterium TaxID=2614124 RepID=UPI0008A5EF52|nr:MULTISPECIES: RdgB/HAM1 family non-canonical purine NTP pyrophosphatase [unclassified Brevibacterium]OFL67264.1 non-canonical purine NTP pyrophosphatase [Brevibacterium sp. HMSC063G07]OFS26024.1 non-canonical purine NTP pyrophosphatase [Brevibacterium sp. HMSC07C04]
MTGHEGQPVVLATGNEGKRAELETILARALPGTTVVTSSALGLSSPVEDGTTFEENALIKARSAAAEAGRPAFADDSGLTVGILGGAPGIFSARWSGSHGDDLANNRLLLAQLADVKDSDRAAAFVCAAAFVDTDGTEIVCRGALPGALARAPHGSGGFGYDPIFIPEGQDRCLAEYSREEKNAVSHRGRAFSELVEKVRAHFAS